jgi:hypothetical protein
VITDSVTQSSDTPLNEININTDELQEIPGQPQTDAMDEGGLMSRRTLALAVVFVCLLTIASVVPAVVYSLMANSSEQSIFSFLLFF